MSPITHSPVAIAFDLFGSGGRVDHGKVMGFLFFVSVIACKICSISYTPTELIVLSVNIYGGRMVLAAIKSGVFNAVLGKGQSLAATPAVQEGRGGPAE